MGSEPRLGCSGRPLIHSDFVRETSDPAEDDGFPPADRAPAAAARGIELLGPPGTLPS